MLRIKYNCQTLANKQKQKCGWLGPFKLSFPAVFSWCLRSLYFYMTMILLQLPFERHIRVQNLASNKSEWCYRGRKLVSFAVACVAAELVTRDPDLSLYSLFCCLGSSRNALPFSWRAQNKVESWLNCPFMISAAAAKVSRRKRDKLYSREVLRLCDCFSPAKCKRRNRMEPENTYNVC